MIRLQDGELAPAATKELAALQREVDALPSHAERVRTAIDLWPSRRQRVVFRAVEEALGLICCGPRRCMFCEDNGAYQIEHFRPKSLYPSLVFAWANYLFACGQCNGPKGDRFALFSAGGGVVELSKSDVEPETGPAVLLDPRRDEPLDYLWLDLRDTFLFKPVHPEGTPEHSRADYTIRWLDLNIRPDLAGARRVAYENYRNGVEAYAAAKRGDASAANLERRRRALLKNGHITVWREMQRQHGEIDELRSLFEEVPEALRW